MPLVPRGAVVPPTQVTREVAVTQVVVYMRTREPTRIHYTAQTTAQVCSIDANVLYTYDLVGYI